MTATTMILVLLAAVAFTAARARRTPLALPLVLLVVGAGLARPRRTRARARPVSSTDATAMNALTRIGLPPRVTRILGDENLINDASALVAFRFALVATRAAH